MTKLALRTSGRLRGSFSLKGDFGKGKVMDDISFTSPPPSVFTSSAKHTTTSDTKASIPHNAPSSTVSGGRLSSKTSNGTSILATSASFAKLLKSSSLPRSLSLHPSVANPTPTRCSPPPPPVSATLSRLVARLLHGLNGVRSTQKLAALSDLLSSRSSCADGGQSKRSSPIMGLPTSPHSTG